MTCFLKEILITPKYITNECGYEVRPECLCSHMTMVITNKNSRPIRCFTPTPHETIDNKWQCQVGEPLLENDQQHFTAS